MDKFANPETKWRNDADKLELSIKSGDDVPEEAMNRFMKLTRKLFDGTPYLQPAEDRAFELHRKWKAVQLDKLKEQKQKKIRREMSKMEQETGKSLNKKIKLSPDTTAEIRDIIYKIADDNNIDNVEDVLVKLSYDNGFIKFNREEKTAVSPSDFFDSIPSEERKEEESYGEDLNLDKYEKKESDEKKLIKNWISLATKGEKINDSYAKDIALSLAYFKLNKKVSDSEVEKVKQLFKPNVYEEQLVEVKELFNIEKSKGTQKPIQKTEKEKGFFDQWVSAGFKINSHVSLVDGKLIKDKELIKESSEKINSNTIKISNKNPEFVKIENLLLKIASINDIDAVRNIDITLSQKEGFAKFDIDSEASSNVEQPVQGDNTTITNTNEVGQEKVLPEEAKAQEPTNLETPQNEGTPEEKEQVSKLADEWAKKQQEQDQLLKTNEEIQQYNDSVVQEIMDKLKQEDANFASKNTQASQPQQGQTPPTQV